MDVDDRATADEALRASWLNRRHTATVRNPHSEEMDNVKRSIKRFAGYSKLRKVALMVVAHRSTTQEIGILRKVFQQYDIDGSGTINYEEFKAALQDVGFTDENYRALFDEIDIDGTGVIRYTGKVICIAGGVHYILWAQLWVHGKRQGRAVLHAANNHESKLTL